MKNERKEELKDEMKNRISLALKDPILQQGFEIICKENAELKLKLEALEGQTPWKDIKDKSELIKENTELKDDNKVMADNYSKMEQKFYDNLTKAKDIIKKLKALYFSPVVTKDDVKRQDEILAEVEQFLNSEVEK